MGKGRGYIDWFFVFKNDKILKNTFKSKNEISINLHTISKMQDMHTQAPHHTLGLLIDKINWISLTFLTFPYLSDRMRFSF